MKKSVCVYCGSRTGAKAEYINAAAAFGTALAQNGYRLVYGAGDVGLMGALARACQTAGGETFGVIPDHLFRREVGKRDLTAFVVTETMHERKKVMFMNADAIVALPGGPGTMDELFEVLTWRQLGLHAKPVLLLDTSGYWKPFLALIDHMIGEGFVEPPFRDYFSLASDVPALMRALA